MRAQVKAVQVNGVAPSADAVKDGSYSVSRPFNIATMGEPEGLAADFINFIMSDEGQAIVEEEDYISQGRDGCFGKEPWPEGEITVGGSSSVTPVMEKLIEGYQALNANANIQLQQSDSTTGMNSAIDGSYDIGMASREVSDSELEAGLSEHGDRPGWYRSHCQSGEPHQQSDQRTDHADLYWRGDRLGCDRGERSSGRG